MSEGKTSVKNPAAADKKHSGGFFISGWKRLQDFSRGIPLVTRLVAIVFVVLLVFSCILALSARQLVESSLLDTTDTQLMRQSDLILRNVNYLQSQTLSSNSSGSSSSGLSALPDGDSNSDANPGISGTSTMGPTDYFLQIRDSKYKILSTPLIPITREGVISVPTLPASGSAGSIELNTPTTVAATVEVTGSSVSNSDLEMAQANWRVLALKYQGRGTGNTYIVYIGLSLYDMYQTTNDVLKYFSIISGATLVAAGVLALIAIRRALRPLKRIEKTAAQIAGGDLTKRIPDYPQTTEIGSLSASLNTMLGRIEKSFKKQEDTTNQMKRFVSDASHELRTPLAAISGYAELYRMQRDYPGVLERADDAIDHIDRSSARMKTLVEDLLSLARLDEGRGIDLNQSVHVERLVYESSDDLHALDPSRPIQLGRAVVDTSSTASVIAQLVKTTEPSKSSEVKNINSTDQSSQNSQNRDSQNTASDNSAMENEGFVDPISIIPGELEKITIGGDPIRIRQVITNVIGNIHRYTPANSLVEIGIGTVQAAAAIDDLNTLDSSEEGLNEFISYVTAARASNAGREFVIIRISDHGPGVPAGERQKIFERFYTADPSRAREKGGTGLGMSIAQSVVKAHHGFIVATETVGGGLTYTVILPASQTQFFRDNQDPTAYIPGTSVVDAQKESRKKRNRRSSDNDATREIPVR